MSELRVGIEGDEIVIAIGVKTLATAMEISEFNNPFDDKANDYRQAFRVVDAREFARDVVRALRDEGEDGSTLVTRVLDKAMEDALDGGSLGVEEVKHKKRKAPQVPE